MRRPQFATVVARFLAWQAQLLTRVLRPRARVYALAQLKESIEPIYVNESRHGPIVFYCPAVWPYSRSDMAKEPRTLAWIDTFARGDVFWDVGANVGVFTLYAATRGHTVWAFEPAAVNFFVLARNVELNRLSDRVTFLNTAISSSSKLDALYMSHTKVGGAQHQFGRPQDDTTHIKRDSYGQANAFRQPVFGYAIDDLVEKIAAPFPSHIKVDVDGNEVDVVRGARKTIADPRVKSLLIEIRPDRREAEIRELLSGAGLVLAEQHGLNHIFVRQPA
jgi:FkbM family methyltransferase